MATCYCGSSRSFKDCCEPYIKGTQKAPTAEALMRSRYSAFATGAADYLVATTHSSTRKFHKKADILAWSKSNQWIKLEVLAVTETTVPLKRIIWITNCRRKCIRNIRLLFLKTEVGIMWTGFISIWYYYNF
ncbi:YchJ family protein [Flavobacterium sp.]|uniref:YchJ family protein n=1 Tax=Flavobacterium sp. TaxID=239 RepID=UPI003FA61435